MANNNSNPLPSVWRWDFSDYTSLGTTFQKFLSQLNIFALAVYNLVNGGIGYSNLQQSLYTFTVTAGLTTPVSFVNPLSITPSCVTLGRVYQVASNNTAITSPVTVSNFYYDGKAINILNIPGLTNGTTYQITVIVS